MSRHEDMNLSSISSQTISGSAAAADEVISRWRNNLREQDTILTEALARNLELEARNKTLEYENWTMRTMLEKLRSESKKEGSKRSELKTQIDILKSEQESFKNENPLIVCLLDGDGCIFSQEYLRQGHAGGAAAAEKLLVELTTHLRSSPERVPPGVRTITMIFLSKAGMESILVRNGVCTSEEFVSFLRGFSAAHPLFSVVDVGIGKEAADHKMRDYLDVFVKMPQTFKVFFGGGHDNGYYGSLAALQTMGLKEKLIMLQSYSQIGREIGALKLPTFKIPGLFLTNKLERRPSFKKLRPQSDTLLITATTSTGKKKKGATVPAKPVKQISSPQSAPPRYPVVESPFVEETSDQEEERLPCLHHHLGDTGCQNLECPFDHDEDLTTEQTSRLMDLALATPCDYINKNRACPLKKCNFGHVCPRGRRCELYAIGTCRFIGLGMHD